MPNIIDPESLSVVFGTDTENAGFVPSEQTMVMVGPRREVHARYVELCEGDAAGFHYLWQRGVRQDKSGLGWPYKSERY